MELFPSGALPDTRSDKEKEKDYLVEEILAGAPVPFQHERPTKLDATVYSQEHTSSCVPHAFLTQLEYAGIGKELSQLRAYRKRANYPQEGSNGVDMYTQIRGGQSPHKEAPVVKGMREPEANALPLIQGEKIIPDFNYFIFRDYATIPAAVAGGKAVAIFIYATTKEWAQEYVEVIEDDLNGNEASVRHAVVLIPSGDFAEKGKEWLAVHDSAAFGKRHLRYISKDFLLKRCYFAATVAQKEDVPPPAEVQQPTTVCEFGQKNGAVYALQSYLAKEGYLGAQYITGYYGQLTAKAVLWYQLKHHEKFPVLIPQLLEWGGKYWGPSSINTLTN